MSKFFSGLLSFVSDYFEGAFFLTRILSGVLALFFGFCLIFLQLGGHSDLIRLTVGFIAIHIVLTNLKTAWEKNSKEFDLNEKKKAETSREDDKK